MAELRPDSDIIGIVRISKKIYGSFVHHQKWSPRKNSRCVGVSVGEFCAKNVLKYTVTNFCVGFIFDDEQNCHKKFSKFEHFQ